MAKDRIRQKLSSLQPEALRQAANDIDDFIANMDIDKTPRATILRVFHAQDVVRELLDGRAENA